MSAVSASRRPDDQGPGASPAGAWGHASTSGHDIPKWHLGYYFLATFDVLTICLSLFLGYQIMRIYTESVDLSQEWTIRSRRYSELSQLAMRVNAPGNDVFDSHDVARESARLQTELDVFTAAMADARGDLAAVAEPDLSLLSAGLDNVDEAVKAMTLEAQQIFAHFNEGRTELAGQRMATMDRKYAHVTVAIAQLGEDVGEIQQENFAQELRSAKALKRGEYLIAGVIVLIVVGVAIYGHYLANKIRMAHQEREEEMEATRRFAAAVEQSPVTIVITDAGGAIQYVNPAFETHTGYTREEAIGGKPNLLQSGKHDREFYEDLWSTIQGGETWSGHFINKRKDGSILEEEATISPVRDASGAISSFVAVKRDVTEEMALEAQLAQAQKLESIGQLAAGIAHEINTPTQYVGDNIRFFEESFGDLSSLVARLKGLVGAARSGVVPGELLEEIEKEMEGADLEYLLEETPRAIGQSLEGVDRVAKIVRAMKEFSHPSTDKTATDLNAAIMSTVTVASNEWKYLAELVTELDEELPHVTCVPGEFNQVILNMVVNAAHAIADTQEEGSVEKGSITIRTRRDGEWAEITLGDTGAGMPEDVKARIFDPFFTTKEVGRGTGQGLSIAHSVIVQKHGGTISVDSEPGEGTTFTIRLPIESASTEDAGAPTNTEVAA